MARIVVIDDDPDFVEAVRLILEAGGHEVHAAGSPEEGRARIESVRPDLVLLDVMMPEATEGFHLVWALRRHPDPAVREVPILLLTALHATTDLRLYPDLADATYGPGEYLPVQGFLEKPVEPSLLLRRIAEVLAVAPTSRRGGQGG